MVAVAVYVECRSIAISPLLGRLSLTSMILGGAEHQRRHPHHDDGRPHRTAARSGRPPAQDGRPHTDSRGQPLASACTRSSAPLNLSWSPTVGPEDVYCHIV